MEENETSTCYFLLMRNLAEQENFWDGLVCKLVEQLLLVLGVEMALLAGQPIKASDGENDRCLLASLTVDWPGGLYRLTFLLLLLLLLAQMEPDVTPSCGVFSQASTSAGSPLARPQRDDRVLRPSSGRLWLHRGGARGSAPAAASSTKLMTHSDEKAS